MLRKLTITASAKQDIQEIKKWYREKSKLSVENFTKELSSTLESLKSAVVEHRIYYDSYHKLSLKKFPYSIYYQNKENNAVVEVNAVLHNHRDPGFISNRLTEE